MRSTLALVFGLGLAAMALGTTAAAAPAVRPFGQAQKENKECAKIDGFARTLENGVQVPLVGAKVRLRRLTGSGPTPSDTMTDATGKWEFTNVQEGTYVVEIYDTAGNLIGVSPTLRVDDDCDPVSGVIIQTGPPIIPPPASFFLSPSFIIVVAAGAIAGIAIARDLASPSR